MLSPERKFSDSFMHCNDEYCEVFNEYSVGYEINNNIPVEKPDKKDLLLSFENINDTNKLVDIEQNIKNLTELLNESVKRIDFLENFIKNNINSKYEPFYINKKYYCTNDYTEIVKGKLKIKITLLSDNLVSDQLNHYIFPFGKENKYKIPTLHNKNLFFKNENNIFPVEVNFINDTYVFILKEDFYKKINNYPCVLEMDTGI
jgi:hypothetical protein